MLSYIFLLTVPSLFAIRKKSKQNNRIYLFLIALLYILFIGFRFQTGGDWPAYTAMYNHISHLTLQDAMVYTEPSYGALNWLMAQMGMGLTAVNVIIAIIFIFGLIRFSKNTPYPFLALVSITPYLIIVIGMSASRQAAAIGLVFLVLANWNQNIIKKVVLSLLAISFHYSAVLVLFFVLYSMKLPSWLKFLILIVGSVVSFWVLKATPKFDEYNQTYAVVNIVSPGAIQHVLLNAIPATIYLFFIKKWNYIYGKNDLMRILAIASIVSLFAVLISSTAADRLSLYLSPIQMLVYSTLPIVFRSSVYFILIILTSFVILFLWLIYSNTAHVFLPYKSVFFN